MINNVDVLIAALLGLVLGLAYAPTLVGHPALSLPVGVDAHGMPFGLQIVGPRGGDALVLSVAAALEALLAGDPRTARPTRSMRGPRPQPTAASRSSSPLPARPRTSAASSRRSRRCRSWASP